MTRVRTDAPLATGRLGLAAAILSALLACGVHPLLADTEACTDIDADKLTGTCGGAAYKLSGLVPVRKVKYSIIAPDYTDPTVYFYLQLVPLGLGDDAKLTDACETFPRGYATDNAAAKSDNPHRRL